MKILACFSSDRIRVGVEIQSIKIKRAKSVYESDLELVFVMFGLPFLKALDSVKVSKNLSLAAVADFDVDLVDVLGQAADAFRRGVVAHEDQGEQERVDMVFVKVQVCHIVELDAKVDLGQETLPFVASSQS